MDREVLKELRRIITVVAVVVLLIVYSGNILSAIGGIIDVFNPFFAGVAIAFVLNIPMDMIEKKFMSGWNTGIKRKAKRAISMISAILIVIGVLAIVVFSLVPQLGDTFKDIADRLPEFNQNIVEYVDDLTKDYPQVNKIVNQIDTSEQDWSGLLEGVTSFMQSGVAGNILTSTVNVASSIAVFVFRAIIAICFAIYLLVSKEKILRNIKTVFKTYMPAKAFKYLHDGTKLLIDTFKKFIAGQCVEAVVLGCIFAITMVIFRIPYAILVSVLIAFTALIPVAGAFIGCAVGAFLILMVSPIKMLWFLILFIILQQLENKLIYPKIVGSSVGLPSIWVFVAVTVGGSISGVVGMLVFIPIASTLYVLLKEDIVRKNKKNASK